MDAAIEPLFQTRFVDERSLTIIDNLFQPSFIKLVDHFLKKLPFSLSDYDDEADRHVLHWIHEFAVEEVAAHPLLSFVYSTIGRALRMICPKRGIQLKRVHCNASLYGDMQLPHNDITPGITWLYFPNPVWLPTWMGETIFYDSEREP